MPPWVRNLLLAVICFVLVIAAWRLARPDSTPITTFDDCVAAGYPIQESYPRRCNDGTTLFTEVISTSSPIVRGATTRSFDVYFSNRLEDPESLQCEKTYAFSRIAQATTTPAALVLTMLLAGPTGAESGLGAATNIPSDVRVLSLAITEGTARVDFSDELRAVASGSCRVSAIRSQIENTLKQFPTVQRVEILVAGEPNVLEP